MTVEARITRLLLTRFRSYRRLDPEIEPPIAAKPGENEAGDAGGARHTRIGIRT